jgi:hypothetical protein
MRTTVRRLATLLIAVGLSAGPLVADASPRHDVEWTPYRTAPFTSPAGMNCTFALRGEPVRDREEIATFATFADGSPRVQQIRGDLRVRYTNLATGRSRVVDLDGIGTIQYFADGGTRLYLDGPAAVGFAPSDPYPAGFYRLDGFHVVYTAPDRAVRRMVVDAGTEHDLCADLG